MKHLGLAYYFIIDIIIIILLTTNIIAFRITTRPNITATAGRGVQSAGRKELQNGLVEVRGEIPIQDGTSTGSSPPFQLLHLIMIRII